MFEPGGEEAFSVGGVEQSAVGGEERGHAVPLAEFNAVEDFRIEERFAQPD